MIHLTENRLLFKEELGAVIFIWNPEKIIMKSVHNCLGELLRMHKMTKHKELHILIRMLWACESA